MYGLNTRGINTTHKEWNMESDTHAEWNMKWDSYRGWETKVIRDN